MAEAVIGPLLGILQRLAVSEAQLLLSVSEDIQRLRDKLILVQAFLRDANLRRRARSDEFTRAWVEQIREVVFNAQDAVEHCFLRVDLSRYPSWIPTSVRFLASFPTQLSARHNLSRQIAAINSRLEGIMENKDVYRPYSVDHDPDRFIPPWRYSSSTSTFATTRRLDDLQQPRLAFYEEEQKRLEEALDPTEQLQNEDHIAVVISVFGKSGIGKTTLVRDIYEEMAKKKCFHLQAMESFAPYLSATNILQQIVQQLTKDNQNCPRNKITEILKDVLENKKYLLVIDGEVSGTEWKNILANLPVCAKGSRIVHITQLKPEEQPSSYHVTIELRNLQEDATIELFRKRLLHTEVPDEYIQTYREVIFKITEGLPLAIVLLSGLVQTKEFPEEWEEVFSYIKSKKSRRLDSILSLCFDDLPHDLESCFLYFAALPANTTIEARVLLCMWMAEGFLISKVGKTMEKVGDSYLNELVARNLVNLVHMDDDSSVGSNFVAIQNKIHDFLLFEAHEASFVEVHSGDDIPTLTSARRLSLQNYTDKYAVLASPLPKLRSIFSQFEQEPKEERMRKEKKRALSKKKKDIRSHIRGLLRGSEFLRVINLQGIEIGEKLPDAIGSVVHLQYLGITSCSLKEIPPSIGRLTSLQTLDVRETNVRKLPLAFWRIKTLRHVFGFVLKLPKKIGSMKNLQTLDSIELDAFDQGLATTLGEMIHLEYLCVWNILNDNVVDLSDALNKLENLRTLMLQGDIIPSSVFTAVSLRRLKFMVLHGDFPLKLSSEVNGMALCLPNLTMLWLGRTNVFQGFISKLAELPSLATLALSSGSYKDEQLVFSSTGFRRLKKLKIDVEVLKKVEIKAGALPKLEKLDIHSHHTGHHHDIEMNPEHHVDRKTSIVVDLLKKENTDLVG